jgi:hypothetical protein
MVSATGTAWAGVKTIQINSGNVPTTAAVGGADCDPNFGGGPFPNKDVWVFVLPGNSGDFVSITAHFNTGSGTTDILIARQSDPGNFAALGTPKAFIITPQAGWTLVSASAVVTDNTDKDFFNLTHTCPASGTPTPPPTTTPPPTPTTPVPTTTAPAGGGSSSTTTAPAGGGSSSTTAPAGGGSSSSSHPGGGTSSSSGSSGGTLPVTGLALTGIIIAAVAMVGGGAALIYTRRRMDRSTGL